MDKLETLSNYSGSISNASSISGLSAYQDEFLELRHTINPEKYPLNVEQRCTTPKQSVSVVTYEERIRDLTLQLQNTLKLNEKYKNDLYNLEKRTELSFHDKIDKLIRHNKCLETELETANNQIERLIKNYSVKDENVRSSLLESKIIKLEKENHSLNVQNSLLQSEVSHWKDQYNELELVNDKLNLELNDIKINITTRDACIKELKEKISQQHLEIQNVMHDNNKLVNQIKSLQIDLTHGKKSEDWYKEQLHLCQTQKQQLIDEITEHKRVVIAQNTEVEKYKNEINKWKSRYEQAELSSIKERENLLKKLELIEQQLIHSNKFTSTENVQFERSDIDKITNSYELKIKELSEEVSVIKNNVAEQQRSYDTIIKENSELIAKCINLQNITQQYESNTGLFENTKKQLNMELKVLTETLHQKNKELLELKEINSKLQVDLTARNQEKELVEISISTLREKFNIFLTNYESLKEELHNKERLNLQLQKEKQQLFMNNNWQICELEKSKEKDSILQKFEQKIKTLESEKQEMQSNNKRCVLELNKKIEELLKEITELQKTLESKTTGHSKEIEIYENTILRYKVDISEFQNEMNNLRILLSEREESLNAIQSNINTTNEKVHQRDQEIVHMKTEYLNLERTFNTKLEQILREKQIVIKENQTLKGNLASFVSNNYSKCDINQLEDRHLQKLMDYVYNVCKKGPKSSLEIPENNSEPTVVDLDVHNIKNLLNKLEHFVEKNNYSNMNLNQLLQEKDGVIENLKLDVQRLKKDVWDRLKLLEIRCGRLKDNTDNCTKMLESIEQIVSETGSSAKPSQEINEDINHLKALLTAKENEQKEIRMRFEVNNRTLLRKVKEHMKGRNSAEKHNQYLQELYNNLSEECNSVKLQLSSKEYEMSTLAELNEQYTNIVSRLKQSVSLLEKENSRNQVCEKCIEFEALQHKLENLQTCLRINETNIEMLQVELKKKDGEIENFTKQLKNYTKLANEHQEIKINLEFVTSEKQELNLRINTLTCLLNEKEEENRKIATELSKYMNSNIEITQENSKLHEKIEEMNNKTSYLSSEVNNLNCNLRRKVEELKQLESDKTQIESSYYKKEQDSINLVNELKIQFAKVQNELSEIKSDKFFLQRICNDLKIALQTNINHNKVLKEQVLNLSKESEYSSLPNNLPNLPHHTKYDDGYIIKLLDQSRTPLNEKPLCDIQSCLDSLKSEIYHLQQQVVQKNVPNI